MFIAVAIYFRVSFFFLSFIASGGCWLKVIVCWRGKGEGESESSVGSITITGVCIVAV